MAKVGAQGLWVAGAPQKAQPGAPRAPSCCHQGCGQHGTSWAPAPRVTPRNGCPLLGEEGCLTWVLAKGKGGAVGAITSTHSYANSPTRM